MPRSGLSVFMARRLLVAVGWIAMSLIQRSALGARCPTTTCLSAGRCLATFRSEAPLAERQRDPSFTGLRGAAQWKEIRAMNPIDPTSKAGGAAFRALPSRRVGLAAAAVLLAAGGLS